MPAHVYHESSVTKPRRIFYAAARNGCKCGSVCNGQGFMQCLEAEKKVNEEIAKKVAEKKAAEAAAKVEAEAAANAEEAPATEEAPAEA